MLVAHLMTVQIWFSPHLKFLMMTTLTKTHDKLIKYICSYYLLFLTTTQEDAEKERMARKNINHINKVQERKAENKRESICPSEPSVAMLLHTEKRLREDGSRRPSWRSDMEEDHGLNRVEEKDERGINHHFNWKRSISDDGFNNSDGQGEKGMNHLSRMRSVSEDGYIEDDRDLRRFEERNERRMNHHSNRKSTSISEDRFVQETEGNTETRLRDEEPTHRESILSSGVKTVEKENGQFVHVPTAAAVHFEDESRSSKRKKKKKRRRNSLEEEDEGCGLPGQTNIQTANAAEHTVHSQITIRSGELSQDNVRTMHSETNGSFTHDTEQAGAEYDPKRNIASISCVQTDQTGATKVAQEVANTNKCEAVENCSGKKKKKKSKKKKKKHSKCDHDDHD